MQSGGASGLLQGSEVFEGSSPVVTGQVLVKFILEGLEAVTIGGAGAEAGDVKAWGVWQVDDEGLGQHQELVFLCIQLHDVGHLVPAKAHKSGIIAGTVSWHHHIGLVVSCPLHAVRGLGLPPAGIVCGRMTPGPLMVPEGIERAGVQQGQQFGLGTGEAEAVVQGLKCWHHQGHLPPTGAQLQLLDGGPEVVVEGVGGQEVNVTEEDVRREGLRQGHVAKLVDGVEGTLAVHHVVGHILPGGEHRRGLHETQELLGLCVCQVQGQAHGARPVPAQGFQHLQPGVRGVVSPGRAGCLPPWRLRTPPQVT